MKLLSIIIAFAFIWSNSYSQKITIDVFHDTVIEKFSDNNEKITAKAVSDGFKIEIKDTASIDSIQQINAAGKFVKINKSTDQATGGKLYDIKDAIVENNILEIKLFKEEKVKTLTLNIQDPKGDNTGLPSKSVLFESKSDCKKARNFENKFGEDYRFYDDETIVYIYDFSGASSSGKLYRITKAKASDKQWEDVIFDIKLKAKEKECENAKKDFKKDPTDSSKESVFRNKIKELNQLKAEEGENSGLKIEVVNYNKETLRPGQNVKFKIYNINKFMYDVSIADSVVQFDSEPSALFTRLFLGDTTLLANLMENISTNPNAQKFTKEDTKMLMEKITDFVRNYNQLKKTALDATNPCHQFTCCNPYDYAYFLDALSNIRAQTENVKRRLNDIKNDKTKEACTSQIKLKAKAEYTVNNLGFAISKIDVRLKETALKTASLENEINQINNEIKEIESQVFYSKGADSLTKRARLLRLGTEATSKKTELAASRLDLTKFQKEKDSLDIKRFEAITSIDSIKTNISMACNINGNSDIEEMINALEASNYLLTHLPSNDEIKRLIIFTNSLIESNNSHTKDYIALNGNMLDLTITISSKDSVSKYTSIKGTYITSIQIPIIWKPFVSFSSGSFIALGKNMQNKTYAWQETVGANNTVDSSKYTLVESGYTLPPMGFCALGNLEWKACRSFGVGGSVGVGLSIEKSPRLTYMGGVSLFFGDLRQFTITGGFSGMQVEKLTNNFQTVAVNQIIYTSKPNIDYYNEFKVGAFMSLTYTPFKVYKNKTVKSQNK